MARSGIAGFTVGAPAPTSIGRISASLAETLRQCGLRAAFKLDPTFHRFERGGVAAALGTVCHALEEAVARGAFDDIAQSELQSALEERWWEEAARAESALKRDWGEKAPDAKRWPGYTPSRHRTLRRCREQAEWRASRCGGSQRQAVVEEELLAVDAPLLWGRPDRVERPPEGARLVDVKSGSAPIEDMRPDHRRQLLFYAYLWHAVHGEWPVTAAIQRVDGQRLEITVDPDEAARVVNEALELRAEFNARVESGSSFALANPSPEACKFCAFKAVCPPFLLEVTEEWGLYRRHVVGLVEQVDEQAGRASMLVRREAGNVAADAAIVHVADSGPLGEIHDGEFVAVVDALPTNQPLAIRVAWDTRSAIWRRAA